MKHSWIVMRKSDGVPVIEIFDKELVEQVNTNMYCVQTAHEYLGQLNAKIRREALKAKD